MHQLMQLRFVMQLVYNSCDVLRYKAICTAEGLCVFSLSELFESTQNVLYSWTDSRIANTEFDCNSVTVLC